MIPMQPSYREYCKKFSSMLPVTMFNMRDIPANKYAGQYQFGDTNIPGTLKGKIELLYVLKSFPKQHDNSKYQLFVLAKKGIFVEEVAHSERDEPIVFRNIFLRWFKNFGPTRYLLINPPNDSRQIMILSEVRYEEVINGVVVSNSYDFNELSEVEKKKIHEHYLFIKAKELARPMRVEFDPNLYKALKWGETYLHLRADNYVPWDMVKPYHPRY